MGEEAGGPDLEPPRVCRLSRRLRGCAAAEACVRQDEAGSGYHPACRCRCTPSPGATSIARGRKMASSSLSSVRRRRARVAPRVAGAALPRTAPTSVIQPTSRRSVKAFGSSCMCAASTAGMRSALAARSPSACRGSSTRGRSARAASPPRSAGWRCRRVGRLVSGSSPIWRCRRVRTRR